MMGIVLPRVQSSLRLTLPLVSMLICGFLQLMFIQPVYAMFVDKTAHSKGEKDENNASPPEYLTVMTYKVLSVKLRSNLFVEDPILYSEHYDGMFREANAKQEGDNVGKNDVDVRMNYYKHFASSRILSENYFSDKLRRVFNDNKTEMQKFYLYVMVRDFTRGLLGDAQNYKTGAKIHISESPKPAGWEEGGLPMDQTIETLLKTKIDKPEYVKKYLAKTVKGSGPEINDKWEDFLYLTGDDDDRFFGSRISESWSKIDGGEDVHENLPLEPEKRWNKWKVMTVRDWLLNDQEIFNAALKGSYALSEADKVLPRRGLNGWGYEWESMEVEAEKVKKEIGNVDSAKTPIDYLKLRIFDLLMLKMRHDAFKAANTGWKDMFGGRKGGESKPNWPDIWDSLKALQKEPPKTEVQIQTVFHVIKNIDPDIVFLQDIDDSWFENKGYEKLEKEADPIHDNDEVPQSESSKDYLAIWSTKAQKLDGPDNCLILVKRKIAKKVSEIEQNKEERFLKVKVELAGGTDLSLSNHHFSSDGKKPKEDFEKYIYSHGDGTHFAIVGGNLNVDPSGAEVDAEVRKKEEEMAKGSEGGKYMRRLTPSGIYTSSGKPYSDFTKSKKLSVLQSQLTKSDLHEIGAVDHIYLASKKDAASYYVPGELTDSIRNYYNNAARELQPPCGSDKPHSLIAGEVAGYLDTTEAIIPQDKHDMFKSDHLPATVRVKLIKSGEATPKLSEISKERGRNCRKDDKPPDQITLDYEEKLNKKEIADSAYNAAFARVSMLNDQRKDISNRMKLVEDQQKAANEHLVQTEKEVSDRKEALRKVEEELAEKKHEYEKALLQMKEAQASERNAREESDKEDKVSQQNEILREQAKRNFTIAHEKEVEAEKAVAATEDDEEIPDSERTKVAQMMLVSGGVIFFLSDTLAGPLLTAISLSLISFGVILLVINRAEGCTFARRRKLFWPIFGVAWLLSVVGIAVSFSYQADIKDSLNLLSSGQLLSGPGLRGTSKKDASIQQEDQSSHQSHNDLPHDRNSCVGPDCQSGVDPGR